MVFFASTKCFSGDTAASAMACLWGKSPQRDQTPRITPVSAKPRVFCPTNYKFKEGRDRRSAPGGTDLSLTASPWRALHSGTATAKAAAARSRVPEPGVTPRHGAALPAACRPQPPPASGLGPAPGPAPPLPGNGRTRGPAPPPPPPAPPPPGRARAALPLPPAPGSAGGGVAAMFSEGRRPPSSGRAARNGDGAGLGLLAADRISPPPPFLFPFLVFHLIYLLIFVFRTQVWLLALASLSLGLLYPKGAPNYKPRPLPSTAGIQGKGKEPWLQALPSVSSRV